MSKDKGKKGSKGSNLPRCFDRESNNWGPLSLITREARQPKEHSNCPRSFVPPTQLLKREWITRLSNVNHVCLGNIRDPTPEVSNF